MKTASSVLDASALLAFLRDEPGADIVEETFQEAKHGGIRIWINEINLGEVFYVYAKKRSLKAARSLFDEGIPLLPITTVRNTFAEVIQAAELKVRLGMPYVDAFVVVTAKQKESVLLTTDPDFRRAEQEVRVRWLR